MGKSLIPIRKVEFEDDAPIKLEWYGVKVSFNYEREAARNITNNMIAHGYGELLADIMVPLVEETVTTTTKTGRKSTRTRHNKIFGYDGYIWVKMVMNRETWLVVRNSTGVTGYLGHGNNPLPLREEEVVNVKKAFGIYEFERAEAAKNFDGEIGDYVSIIDGAMKGLGGTISEIHQSKGSLKIELPNGMKIDANFGQVEKV